MGLTKLTFGDLIEQCNIRNSDGKYQEDSCIGVNIDKEIRVMRGDSSTKELETFFVVKPDFFVYNPRGSRKLGLGYNNSDNTFITTFNNVIFKVKDEARKNVLPLYLFMYLSRKEWDRRAEYVSWGSSTEVFTWNTFCDIEINLPDIETQRHFVSIYQAMLDNQRAYEKGLEDLKLTCDAYIENLRREMECEEIGKYIEDSKLKNTELKIKKVQGVESSGQFIETKAKMEGVDISKYKIVKKNDFVFTPTRINIGSIALCSEQCVVSPFYEVFRIKETTKLLPEYLFMWLRRTEFFRWTLFKSDANIRQTFEYENMSEVKIPIPPIETQQYIVDIYNAYIKRREINERLKKQIKDICPILIRGSIKN